MSATNQTTYYDLPLFIGTDVPSWLGDWNNTMNAIDSAINGVKTTADSATNVANTAEGKSDANTETINSLSAEVQTLKAAVKNYDAILNFKQVNLAINPNNTRAESNNSAFMVQNTNKTLNRLWFSIFLANPWSNPTSYVYTENGGTSSWYDLFTIEDNCFNLNQGSLPNQNIVLTVGPFVVFISSKYNGAFFLRAWYDGATTHFGFCTNRAVSDLQGSYICGIMPVFLSGSVYNPEDPNTGDE